MRNSKVDYVESKLDEAIRSLKEAIKDSEARWAVERQAMEVRLAADRQATEARLAADRQAMEARLDADRQATEAKLENERKAAENRLAADREEFKLRFAEERKEWRSHKRWMYLNFGGLIALIITVVLAIINGDIPFNSN